jgi:flagellar biosynthesis chaperone FliJ
VGRFRFRLESLLDQRAREEERARTDFVRAGNEHRRMHREQNTIDAASAMCDRSAFTALDIYERGSAARRRAVRLAREAEERTRIIFEQAHLVRMQLTILRKRAYEAFLEEEERAAAMELDEVNRSLHRAIT